jgi:hypothetical protein
MGYGVYRYISPESSSQGHDYCHWVQSINAQDKTLGNITSYDFKTQTVTKVPLVSFGSTFDQELGMLMDMLLTRPTLSNLFTLDHIEGQMIKTLNDLLYDKADKSNKMKPAEYCINQPLREQIVSIVAMALSNDGLDSYVAGVGGTIPRSTRRIYQTQPDLDKLKQHFHTLLVNYGILSEWAIDRKEMPWMARLRSYQLARIDCINFLRLVLHNPCTPINHLIPNLTTRSTPIGYYGKEFVLLFYIKTLQMMSFTHYMVYSTEPGGGIIVPISRDPLLSCQEVMKKKFLLHHPHIAHWVDAERWAEINDIVLLDRIDLIAQAKFMGENMIIEQPLVNDSVLAELNVRGLQKSWWYSMTQHFQPIETNILQERGIIWDVNSQVARKRLPAWFLAREQYFEETRNIVRYWISQGRDPKVLQQQYNQSNNQYVFPIFPSSARPSALDKVAKLQRQQEAIRKQKLQQEEQARQKLQQEEKARQTITSNTGLLSAQDYLKSTQALLQLSVEYNNDNAPEPRQITSSEILYPPVPVPKVKIERLDFDSLQEKKLLDRLSRPGFTYNNDKVELKRLFHQYLGYYIVNIHNLGLYQEYLKTVDLCHQSGVKAVMGYIQQIQNNLTHLRDRFRILASFIDQHLQQSIDPRLMNEQPVNIFVIYTPTQTNTDPTSTTTNSVNSTRSNINASASAKASLATAALAAISNHSGNNNNNNKPSINPQTAPTKSENATTKSTTHANPNTSAAANPNGHKKSKFIAVVGSMFSQIYNRVHTFMTDPGYIPETLRKYEKIQQMETESSHDENDIDAQMEKQSKNYQDKEDYKASNLRSSMIATLTHNAALYLGPTHQYAILSIVTLTSVLSYGWITLLTKHAQKLHRKNPAALALCDICVQNFEAEPSLTSLSLLGRVAYDPHIMQRQRIIQEIAQIRQDLEYEYGVQMPNSFDWIVGAVLYLLLLDKMKSHLIKYAHRFTSSSAMDKILKIIENFYTGPQQILSSLVDGIVNSGLWGDNLAADPNQPPEHIDIQSILNWVMGIGGLWGLLSTYKQWDKVWSMMTESYFGIIYCVNIVSYIRYSLSSEDYEQLDNTQEPALAKAAEFNQFAESMLQKQLKKYQQSTNKHSPKPAPILPKWPTLPSPPPDYQEALKDPPPPAYETYTDSSQTDNSQSDELVQEEGRGRSRGRGRVRGRGRGRGKK